MTSTKICSWFHGLLLLATTPLVMSTSIAHAAPATLTVALAENPQMQTAEKLIDHFYAIHPDIKVRFQIMPENQLRSAVQRDVSQKLGEFDVVMIGAYEIPIWAKNGWISDLTPFMAQEAAWGGEDLLAPIRDLVSYRGKLFAAPFYGSSSFMFYRKDLFETAGLEMPTSPSWPQVAEFAKKLTNRDKGISGICLRGQQGWGQNLAPLTTVMNTFGGRWFDEKWAPALSDPKSSEAIHFYVNLVKKYGQPDAGNSGWQECMKLFTKGQAAMWYDDTVFAGPVLEQVAPNLRKNIGFAMAPTKEALPSGWLWAWGLSITPTSRNQDAAWKLISWLTSREYIRLAGEKSGWSQIPPGSRFSTYRIPEYQTATTGFGALVKNSIAMADPRQATTRKVPYSGVQYVSIPEFEQIGNFTSQQISRAISGSTTVDEAIRVSEAKIAEIMRNAGYLKQ